MKSAPSATFRRLCLALALLAASWAFPGPARGDFYPLQTVKTIADTLKPNILILLDSAESMQGLPGEGPTHYNSVGADCEEGSRYCRLVDQDGRYAFSGMGQNGVYFGGTPPGCTHTQTATTTSFSYSQTSTTSCTGTSSGTANTSVNGAGTGNGTGTATKTVTGTGVSNAVATATGSGSTVVAATVTGSGSATAIGTAYPGGTGTAAGTTFSAATATTTQTMTTTKTSASAVIVTNTLTISRTATLTGTVTSTTTATLTLGSSSQTTTATQTVSAIVPITGTVTRSGTVSATSNATASDTGTVSGTVTLTSTQGPTATAAGTGTGTYMVSTSGGTAVFTSAAGSFTAAQNATATTTQTITIPTVTATVTQTGTGTGTVTQSGTATVTATASGGSISGQGTAYDTGYVYVTSTPAGTSSATTTVTYSSTATSAFTWTFKGTGPSPQVQSNDLTGTAAYGPPLQLASWDPPVNFTATGCSVGTSTQTLTTTGSFSQKVNNVTWTVTYPGTASTRGTTAIVTGTWTDTQNSSIAGIISGTKYTTATVASATATTTSTTTWSTTQTTTLGSTHPLSGTVTGTVTGTTDVVIGTATVAGSATVTASATATGTGQWAGNVTVTASGTVSATGTQTVSGSATATGSVTYSGTVSATGTINTSTGTSSCSASQTLTGTTTDTVSTTGTAVVTVTDCAISGGSDLGRCDQSPPTPAPTTQGYCNDSGIGALCSLDNACSATRGEFCRHINFADDFSHGRAEPCFNTPGSGSAWGSCKRGRTTDNTNCGPASDSSCNTSGDQDFCAEGKPAKMCRDSGLWCMAAIDCPADDPCVPATSRMMTVKRALRRAVTEFGDKVNFGFMNTYQAPALATGTCTDTSTCIYPYVKLASCPATVDVTETKLFTRGELERLGAFTILRGNPIPPDGPASSFTWNGVTYTKTSVSGIASTGDSGAGDSRWVIPRSDGSGKFNHYTADWSSCPGGSNADIRPACSLSPGTGIYEGSYYTFTYKRGTPVADGSDGSMQHPMYASTFLGKYYYADALHCYNLIDAERSDIVNDGIYNRKAYVLSPTATSPYTATGTVTSIDTGKEIYVDPPWTGAASVSTCNSASGAIWNANAVPFLNRTDSTTATGTATDRSLAIAARLDKASQGGVAAVGSAPIGCALNNDGAPGAAYGASAYMSLAMANDTTNNGGKAPCWTNNIILVVDGHANGPGDEGAAVDCASPGCASETPTEANGCLCPAINKAYALAQSGVQTHVVVNAPSYWATSTNNYAYPYYTYAFMVNLALAGSRNANFPNNTDKGIPRFAATEEEVYKAVSDKIAAAAYRFFYTTGGAVAGASTQDPSTQMLSYSTKLFDTAVLYPTWAGDVRGFDTASGASLDWSARLTAAGTAQSPPHPSDWTGRRIYFSDKSGNIVKVAISGQSITNASTLHSAGLGSSDAEAGLIMQWLLGKPELGNPAPLMGSISASTPIAVGQAAANGLNGSSKYSENTWKRPQLVYVGSDDGMLHAFFAAGQKLGSIDYYGGEEAFAFIPNDMLPVIAKLYAQGGQKLPLDKDTHIFGLASSPKVKDMCIGNGCATSDGSDWHTVLVMGEGPGGNMPFALDITTVIDANTGLHPENMSLLWSTAPKVVGQTAGVKLPTTSDGDKWMQSLGETTSIPSFYLAGNNDNRVLFASGYPVTARAGAYAYQGLAIVNANAATGAVIDALAVPNAATTCSNTRAVLADIALARDYSSAATSQNLMGAYVGDTWGNVFQYVPSAHSLTTLFHTGSSGCDQPIYFAPAVVQLDRSPKADTSSKHFIYLVQVTGSALDPTTSPLSGSHPGSQIVVTKLDGNVSPPTIVTSYNKLNASGQTVLTTDSSAQAGNRICLQAVSGNSTTQFTNSMKSSTQSCADVGGTFLPETARPVATPTVVLRSDGLGFQAITPWYDPTAMTNDCSSGHTFSYGKSYVTVHEFGADGTWFQIAGVTLNDTALTGIVFVGTGLFVDGLFNSMAPQSISVGGETFSKMQQALTNFGGLERYLRTTWTERVDM